MRAIKTFPERVKTFPERMKTDSERMKSVPERMEIVTENVPTGFSRCRPRRNPGCDYDTGDKLRDRAAPENDLRSTHDMTRSRRM
jgi:hypothetical protein